MLNNDADWRSPPPRLPRLLTIPLPASPPLPKSRPEFGPTGLPLLPKINSPEVETRVFTHRSFAARPTHVFEDSPEDPSPDNEQFSHVPPSLQCVCAADDLLS